MGIQTRTSRQDVAIMLKHSQRIVCECAIKLFVDLHFPFSVLANGTTFGER